MKYIIIIGDGMADRPVKELDGKTPLQVARTPYMDRLAQEGTVGMVRTVPPGLHPGSDIANLSILGYDPKKYYTGRAPLEAASMNITLGDNDVAYRCNLVTLKYDKDHTRALMEDYSGGHISTQEASVLIADIGRALGNEKISFHPGVSYRHLMVWRDGKSSAECVPPHDIIGREIVDYLPAGAGEEVLRSMMFSSVGILERHPVNRERVAKGKKPANSIWFWGQGKKPSIPLFKDKYAVSGALVSAVDLTKGLGVYAGFDILQVPGVTGYIDTNYEGKARYSLDALSAKDLVYIHVEAPDEAGHSGNLHDKIRAIEDIDALVVGTILNNLKPTEEYRILLMPDHATPIEVRTHTEEPVPFTIYDSREKRDDRSITYDETISCREHRLVFEEGYRLMDYFIRGE